MPQAVPDEPELVTDEQIGRAIQKGSEYLCAQFGPLARPDRILAQPNEDPCYVTGRDALAVYALLQCSLAIDDPRLNIKREEFAALVEALKRYDLRFGRYQTYAHGIRATALAVLNRPEDRDVLRADAQWLIDNCDGGAYTYAYALTDDQGPPAPPTLAPPPPDGGPSLNDEVSKLLGREPVGQPAQPAAKPDTPPAPLKGRMFAPRPQGTWDNSNSQYGLLGVWAAAEAGFEVPDLYWAVVAKHWTDCQVGQGNWSYLPGMDDGYLAMTCAGLASLLVTHDYLEPAEMGDGATSVGRDPYTAPVRKALDWFERGNDAMLIKPGPNRLDRASYTLFGLERVGLASGFKHFGANDWYKLIARHLVHGQRRDGSWGDGVIDTSYSLLCLARGRHPIVMTKLRFDGTAPFGPAPRLKPPRAAAATTLPAGEAPWIGYWANRPRDAANLAHFAGKQLEHQLNWQIVNIERNWTEWNDGPVLELASHAAPRFTEQDLGKLRDFVEAGGLLFTQADGGSEEFNVYAGRLAHDLFPQYKLVDVPPTHPIYTHDTVYNIDPRPPLKMVSNGARILMLHSPTDITRFWQQRDDIRHRNAFQLGVNLFVYAAGKRDLRNRLQTAWVTTPNAISLATVKVARVDYEGNWDPEPRAWTRYSNWLQRQTGTRIETQKVAIDDLKTLDPAQVPIAHLTGTDTYRFLGPDAAAVRAYVEAGGVLLIDTCGGSGTFGSAADALLAAAFPNGSPQVLQANHPLLVGGNPGTQDVSQRRLRQDTALRLGRTAGNLRFLTAGKGHVLIASLDITTGLLGTNTTGILGYDPAYTDELVKNLVFWTLDGQAEK